MVQQERDIGVKRTLIERLNSTLPIPYWLSTLIAAALLGPVGFYIADLLSYADPSKATTVFLNSSLDHYTLSQLVGNNIVYPAIIFYSAFMLRYMRQRISRVEQELLRESPEWTDTVRRSFGSISRTGPALAITLVIFVLSYPLAAFQVGNNQGLAQLYFLITFPLFFFGAGSFIWMYVSSLWGLYKIGTQPLKLKPYTEDTLLGLGGFGRISLTLTTVFLVAVFLVVFEFTAFSTAMPVLLTVFFSGVLIMIGVCMFFLPLTNIHRRMISEREQLRNRNMSSILNIVSDENTGKDRSTPYDLMRILALEHEGEQISSIPSWPFDTPVVKTVAGIVLAVVASTSAHMIIVFLHI